MEILEIRNLTLIMGGKKILDNLNMDFREGRIHAVVGPNGAGKSTLASAIMGLTDYKNFEGDIIFRGESIKELCVDERARKGITLGWQEPARFEGLTVNDYIKTSAVEKNQDYIKEMLDKVGLEPDEYLSRAVDKTLSGGERKKIELASLLAMKPKVAILDEPDSGIDIESIKRIFEAIKILKGAGTTVLLITHSIAVLEKAEHAFLICHGKLMGKGNVDNIKCCYRRNCTPCDHKNEPAEIETGK